MSELEIEIRPDLADISNVVIHLHQLARYFHENNVERWPELWYGRPSTPNRRTLEETVYSIKDPEFQETVEGVYREGRNTAVTLSTELEHINYIELCPRVSDYVEKIRGYQEWIEGDSKMLEQCEQLVEDNPGYETDYWAIRAMIRLHRKQLKILQDLEGDLQQIETSERYRIENQSDEASHVESDGQDRRKVFIIHGHDEARWRELEKMLADEFGLDPIILQEQPDRGANTIIEKFEHYASQCSYAFAIFTPDDEIENNGMKYLQARPNVMFELGWFCAYKNRGKVMLLLQEKTEVFSDLQGVIQKRFHSRVSEQYRDIRNELIEAQILTCRE